MNGVIGMLELLQHSSLTPQQQHYAQVAKNSGIELVNLLNDILDLSRVEAERLELEPVCFNLSQLVGEIMDLLALQAHDKGVILYSTLEASIPGSLYGDARRLRQIIINLVGNAIKFTPRKGTVTLTVRLAGVQEEQATVRFEVVDTGIGVAREQLQDIFLPFRQADSSTTRMYGGSGLGLAISKRLTELMGGSIGVESEVGSGSTFWFELPLRRSASASALPASCAPAVSAARPAQAERKTRLLLVEDDPIAREMMPKLLKEYGYLVEVACDGPSALRILEERDYALVLMDCMMPEVSGYQVTQAIRDPATPVRRHDIPVLALTGNVMEGDRDRCLEMGMNDVIGKPLVLETLLAKIEAWVQGREEKEG
jgi:CheY-like chemotaxis protein